MLASLDDNYSVTLVFYVYIQRFYLAGNPEVEFNQRQGEGISQQNQSHWDQGSNNNNIFSGFDTSLLAEALNVDIEIAMKVQGQNDQTRSQIVRVEGRFGFLHPPIRSSSHGQRTQQEQLDEQQEQQGRHDNGLGETLCNIGLKEYLGDPRRADIYTPQAGRINTLNNNDMPILKHMSLSAETGFLYNVSPYTHYNVFIYSLAVNVVRLAVLLMIQYMHVDVKSLKCVAECNL